MKCGRCKGSHATVDQVRACYGLNEGRVAVIERPQLPFDDETTKVCKGCNAVLRSSDPDLCEKCDLHSTRTPLPLEYVEKPPTLTEKQAKFLTKLLEERPSFRDVENMWPENVAKLSKSDASKLIDRLTRTRPESKEAVARDLDTILDLVDDGYYAFPSKTGTNDLDFVRVGTDRSDHRVVNRVLGGQGNIKITRTEQTEFAKILAAMTVEARRASMILFGREIGRCCVCGKTLTDEASRAAGIGPVCEAGF